MADSAEMFMENDQRDSHEEFMGLFWWRAIITAIALVLVALLLWCLDKRRPQRSMRAERILTTVANGNAGTDTASNGHVKVCNF